MSHHATIAAVVYNGIINNIGVTVTKVNLGSTFITNPYTIGICVVFTTLYNDDISIDSVKTLLCSEKTTHDSCDLLIHVWKLGLKNVLVFYCVTYSNNARLRLII